MTHIRMLGTGHALPDRIITNHDLSSTLDTTDEWIRTRTGIEERRIAQETDRPSDLGTKAALAALEMSGIDVNQIDGILVATSTSAFLFPSTACLIQQQLGAKGFAFDVSAACAGFNYAVHLAHAMISSGSAKHLLVVGVDFMSRTVDWKDRSTCVLFGDGAGAVVLGASHQPGVLYSKIYADGSSSSVLCASSKLYDESIGIAMQGQALFRLAVQHLKSGMQDMIQTLCIDMQRIDWLIPHQANERIIDSAIAGLGFPKERVVLELKKLGNTASASIPIALDRAVRDGRIQRGHYLALESFGGGLTWGCALVIF